MKHLLVFTLVLLALTLNFSSGSAQIYAPAESKQSINFPAAFTEEVTQGEAQKTVKATCEVDGQTYFLGYTVHETEITDHKDMAQVSADSFLQVIGGKLITQWEWELDGNQGLKSVLVFAEGTLIMEYRTILKGQIQYQALVYAPIETYNSEKAGDFLKSFKLVE